MGIIVSTREPFSEYSTAALTKALGVPAVTGDWINSEQVGLVIGHTNLAGFDISKYTLGYLNAVGLLPSTLSDQYQTLPPVWSSLNTKIEYGLYEFILTHQAGACSLTESNLIDLTDYQHKLSETVKRFAGYLSKHPGGFYVSSVTLDHEFTAVTWTNENTWWVDHILGVKHQGDREIPYVYATDEANNLWAIKPPKTGNLPTPYSMLALIGVHDRIWLSKYNNIPVVSAGSGDARFNVQWNVDSHKLRRVKVAGPEWNTES